MSAIVFSGGNISSRLLLAILAALNHHSYPRQRTQEKKSLGDVSQLSNLFH